MASDIERAVAGEGPDARTYDFDEVIDRRGTNSLKWDFAAERGKPEGVLPLWVADMDFRAPQPVLDALQAEVKHGIFGYSEVKDGYYQAVARWFAGRFGWQTRLEWLVKTPGVVFALGMAVRALTEPGDGVLIQPPVYYPFHEVIQDNDRRLVESELVYRDGRYSIDFEDFERKVEQGGVRLFLLCSPHNPVGRVWTREELSRLGTICAEHDVYVVSDEIHCDFATFLGHEHLIFPQACPELAERCVVATAPTKTFNLAGLQVSNIWIPGEEVRGRFTREIARTGYSQLGVMGMVAGQAAYEQGAPWLAQCQAYLRGNLDFLRDFLRERLPEVRLVEPEGMFFAWLDCSGLGCADADELDGLVTNRAHLWVDAGRVFGGHAEQFQRLVLACPRSTLRQALEQLEAAVRTR